MRQGRRASGRIGLLDEGQQTSPGLPCQSLGGPFRPEPQGRCLQGRQCHSIAVRQWARLLLPQRASWPALLSSLGLPASASVVQSTLISTLGLARLDFPSAAAPPRLCGLAWVPLRSDFETYFVEPPRCSCRPLSLALSHHGLRQRTPSRRFRCCGRRWSW